jgi:hypothetical protein
VTDPNAAGEDASRRCRSRREPGRRDD